MNSHRLRNKPAGIIQRLLIMKNKYIVFLILSFLFILTACNNPHKNEIVVLCGASMRTAMEEIKNRYAKVSTDKILINYGGSGELCAQIKLSGRGDIFLCHDPFMPWAEKNGLITRWGTLAYLDPVIIVPKENKKNIEKFSDLARPGLRIGIGDTTYSTSGHVIKNALKNSPFGNAVMSNVVAQSKGHQTRCNYVVEGALDAAIVWNAVAHEFSEKLKTILMPKISIDSITSATYQESDLKNVKVTVGVTTKAKDSQHVNRFYDFIISDCKDIFVKHGFRKCGLL